MLGNLENPGVMFLTMMELYRRIDASKDEKTCEVAVSYCEVRMSQGERERGKERVRERGGRREREMGEGRRGKEREGRKGRERGKEGEGKRVGGRERERKRKGKS